MSYTNISSTTPKARKPHRCIWCGKTIEVGEIHEREVGTYFGDFQDHRYHKECREVGSEITMENDGEFEPYENERPVKKP